MLQTIYSREEDNRSLSRVPVHKFAMLLAFVVFFRHTVYRCPKHYYLTTPTNLVELPF